MKALAEIILVMLGVVSMVFGAFWLMEERHAQKTEILELKSKALITEYELRAEMLDDQIDEGNKIRVYYQDKEEYNALDKADEKRFEYVEEQLERRYEEQAIMQERLYELKK